MNLEQIKSIVRWVLTVLSGAVLGWLGARNILTAEQLAQVGSYLTSESVVSLIIVIGTLIWSVFTHTTNNTIKAAANLPEVAKVELQPTEEGRKIQEEVGSTPKATVTVATKGK